MSRVTDEVYVKPVFVFALAGVIRGQCSRCGEYFPIITSLRPPIGEENDENACLLCHDCFLLVCEEQLEELVANLGWTKKFEDGQWCCYPPEEVIG